jgi:hypothetical protein
MDDLRVMERDEGWWRKIHPKIEIFSTENLSPNIKSA